MKLTLNKKTTIFKFKQGITFLGYRIKFNYNKNCVDVRIRQKSINRHTRKYNKQLKLVEKNDLDPETVLQSLESWYAYSDYKQEKKNKKVLRIYNLQKTEIKGLMDGIEEENKDPEIKELLEQLEYAKMENDILKKLATLVQARKEKEQQQSKN